MIGKLNFVCELAISGVVVYTETSGDRTLADILSSLRSGVLSMEVLFRGSLVVQCTLY